MFPRVLVALGILISFVPTWLVAQGLFSVFVHRLSDEFATIIVVTAFATACIALNFFVILSRTRSPRILALFSFAVADLVFLWETGGRSEPALSLMAASGIAFLSVGNFLGDTTAKKLRRAS